ncbi:NtaA/DmoA family FMN-dependent monooxygenase [Caulobacter sp. CCNWLY153]|uniref:NtaA/DmoA family FMN-dependent monooxygenase n=1 Tax=unclassified Caulobacter TaxID=2648921 RepID=UPI002FEF0969
MTRPGKLCIGLSLAITWLNGEGWRHPDSDIENIHCAEFYIDIAKRAEAAKLDFLFRPDSLFLDASRLSSAPGFSSLDPTLLLTAIGRETQRIGLVSTASTSFYPPYVVARQIQSLNWLSRGRAGWNIVTSMDGSANFGDEPMLSSAERYAKAREFTDVVQALWASYPDEALVLDRAAGLYANAERVRPIHHRGRHFSVGGPLTVPTYPGAKIPLFQAGASEWGRDFAARVAHGVFAAAPDIAAGIDLRADLRARASAHGRDPDDLRVLPGLSLFLADTEAEARDLHAHTHVGQNLQRKVAYILENLGIDVSAMPTDMPISLDMLPRLKRPVRSRTHADLLRRLIERETPTVGDLLDRPEVSGSAHWLFVGTPQGAAREIVQWFEAGAADGFISLPGGSARSMQLLFENLMPQLVEDGLFDGDYRGGNFAEHLGI